MIFNFSTTFALAALLLSHVAHALPFAEHTTRGTTVRATFDASYDNPSGSLNNVACSNGGNGLAALFPTFGNVPTFPFIGGVPGVVFNSPNCGGCWKLTNKTGASLIMTAVDSAGSSFNLATEAFKILNGGQIGQGVMELDAKEIDRSACGLRR